MNPRKKHIYYYDLLIGSIYLHSSQSYLHSSQKTKFELMFYMGLYYSCLYKKDESRDCHFWRIKQYTSFNVCLGLLINIENGNQLYNIPLVMFMYDIL